MTVFDRYLLRTLTAAIFITLLFLLGIDFLVRSSDESGALGGKFTYSVVALSLLLQIPSRIIEFMPAAILVGTLMGLGQLNSQNELTIARTSGVSRLRISRAAILLALALGTGLIAIGEYIAPPANAKSDLIYSQARGRTAALYRQGLWLQNADSSITNIGSLNQDGSISNIRFYRQTEAGTEIREAGKGVYQNGSWQLADAKTFTISKTGVTQPAADTGAWQTSATPTSLYSLASSNAGAGTGTIAELYTLTGFLKSNGIAHASQSLQLWQRILLPFSALTMVLLALPFAFNQSRSGSGGMRLVIGIFLGVTYYITQGILSSLAILLGWPPLLGALLPILLLGIPPLIALRRD